MDAITISELELRCIIGIHPWERVTAQPLRFKLSFTCDTRKAARSGRIEDTIDYSAIASLVIFVLTAGKFFLLETALEAIAASVFSVLAPELRPESVMIEVTKPLAFGGTGSAAIRISRTPQDFAPKVHNLGAVLVTEVFAHTDIFLQHLSLEAGAEGALASALNVAAIWAAEPDLVLSDMAVPPRQLVSPLDKGVPQMKNLSPGRRTWFAAGRRG